MGVLVSEVGGPDGILIGADGVARCFWGGGEHADYVAYHDTEWGFPVTDDVRLFEKLCLEGFQAGLSWLTILRKRDGFRRAFAGFDFGAVARVRRGRRRAAAGGRRRSSATAARSSRRSTTPRRCVELVAEHGIARGLRLELRAGTVGAAAALDLDALRELAQTAESTRAGART